MGCSKVRMKILRYIFQNNISGFLFLLMLDPDCAFRNTIRNTGYKRQYDPDPDLQGNLIWIRMNVIQNWIPIKLGNYFLPDGYGC